MKIKLFEELGNVEESAKEYEWIGESIIDHFFESKGYNNIAHSELFYDEKELTLVIEFYTLDLDSGYLQQITEYLKFIEIFGKHKFHVQPGESKHSECIAIEAIFENDKIEVVAKEIEKIFGLKHHPDVNKYNI